MSAKRSSIRIRPENVRVGLFGIEIGQEKRKVLIKGLGINDDSAASRVMDEIKTALRHHAEMVRLDKKNDSPEERKRKLSAIARNGELLSKALPLDYESYLKILSYMKSSHSRIERLNYSKKMEELGNLLNEISLAATYALKEVEGSDDTELSHFRCTLMSDLEAIWVDATKSELTRTNKNTLGPGMFTPVQFTQEVLSIIDPSFNEAKADALVQYYRESVASGKKFD